MGKYVKFLNFQHGTNPELMDKLNEVAARQTRSVHNLAYHILTLALDKEVNGTGNEQLNESQTQPAGG